MNARKPTTTPAAQHRAPNQHGPPGCSQDRLDRSAASSDCPTPPGAVPVAEDAVMLIVRQVAQEVGSALAGELRARATASHDRPEFMTVVDLAGLLRVGEKTIRRWRLERYLPEPLVLRGVIRWRRSDVDAWLQAQEATR